MSYDAWRTESDLDELDRLGKLYSVLCMHCDRVTGESTVSDDTGLCDDCLEKSWPELVGPESRIFEVRREGRLVARAEVEGVRIRIDPARNVPDYDRLDEGELELVEETIRAYLACPSPPPAVKIWPNLAVTPARRQATD